MDLKLEGKHAVITGSTKGIGRAIAAELLEEGASVVINGSSEASVNEAMSALPSSAKLHGCAAAQDTAEGVRKLIDYAADIAPIDILINNVGIFQPVPFEKIDDDAWNRFYQTNVMSGVRASRAVMDGMRAREWGRIIFISSESGMNIPTEMVHYGMTKTAQLAIARGLAETLRATGVTVNSVLPGPTWTEGVSTFVKQMAEQEGMSVEDMKKQFVKQNRPTSLIERFADPGEVAGLVAFLCSPKADAITGSAYRVEGGIVNVCF